MSDNASVSANASGNGKRRTVLLIISAVFVLIAVGWFLFWLLVLSQRETTDDAYLAGNLVSISAQSPGTIVAVMADDTQRVEAGAVLVKLDPTDAQVTLDQAAASLAQTVRQIRQQSASADQFDAAIHSRELELAQAQADLERRAPLAQSRAIAPEELTHAQSAVDQARAALIAAQRQAAAAHAPIEGTDTANQPAVLQAKAAYVQAWVALHRATVLAPVGGQVAQRNAQIGQRVAAGQSLMTIVPLSQLWVDANFKEAQLRHLRMNQPVEVHTDVYGGDVVFHGHVAGVAAGTGSAFSLLPAQNASGNWIKVVQRVAVRIALDPNELAQRPLRIGLSAEIKVDTHDTSGAVLAPVASSTPVAATDVYASDYATAAAQADQIIQSSATRAH